MRLILNNFIQISELIFNENKRKLNLTVVVVTIDSYVLWNEYT